MADVSTDQARREARRKRILANSENRLQKITGKFTEKTSEENTNNDVSYSFPKVDNSISSKILASESQTILEEKRLNFLAQDNSFDIKDYELEDSISKFQQSDDLFSSAQRPSKSSRETFDSINSNSINSQQNLAPSKPQSSFLITLLYSPLCNILLAIIVNALLVLQVDFSLYKGLIVPYLVIAITRLCLQYKAEESQGSSMLVAALILCNIKPEVVHTLKKVLAIISTFTRDFALYITSFTLINWVISFCWQDSNSLNFL